MPEYSVQRFLGGYAIVYKDAGGKRHRERLRARDRAGAEAEARRGWAAGDGSSWTVARIVNAYISDREAEGIASTQRQRDAWKAMRGFWEPVSPDLIDREMAQSYAAQRNVAPATLRYELGMLGVALRWAEERGYIKRAVKIWRPPASERVARHLTHAEFEKWYAQVKAPHARLYVLLGLYTMARPAAILELTWDRIDWNKKEVDFNPAGRRQTRKRRPVVALHPEAFEALKTAYLGRQCQYVIERGAKPVKSLKKAFQAASERSGIHATPYTLRHTGAVWAAEGGAAMDQLAQFMGHQSSASTFKFYARFSPGYLRRVADAVQRRK